MRAGKKENGEGEKRRVEKKGKKKEERKKIISVPEAPQVDCCAA